MLCTNQGHFLRDVLPACMSMHHVLAVPVEVRRVDALELDLQKVVSHHVVAED